MDVAAVWRRLNDLWRPFVACDSRAACHVRGRPAPFDAMHSMRPPSNHTADAIGHVVMAAAVDCGGVPFPHRT